MERIVRKVDDESEARLGQEYWRIFKEGTPEERDRVTEEMDAALSDSKENSDSDTAAGWSDIRRRFG